MASPNLCSKLFILKKANMSVFSSSLFKFSEKPISQPWKRNFSSLSRRSIPKLLLPPKDIIDPTTTADQKTVSFRFFSPAEMDVVKLTKKLPEPLSDAECVGSSHGWLAYLNRRDCRFYLADFFSPSSISISPEIIPLPSIETLPCVSHAMTKSRPDSSSSSFIQKFVMYDFKERIVNFFDEEPDWIATNLVCRLALSTHPHNNNCVVVVIHKLEHKLAFCRLGDPSWTRLDSPLSKKNHFVDVIYSNKDQLFYALASNGDVEAWDLHGDDAPKKMETDDIDYIVPPGGDLSKYEEDFRSMCSRREYLVETPSGEILRIWRYHVTFSSKGNIEVPDDDEEEEESGCVCPYKTVKFEVCKLDFEQGKGEYLANLGDTALFVGFNHSFALSVVDFPELKPNSIYFADDRFRWRIYFAGYDMGIYNLENQGVTILNPRELNNILPGSIWVAPNP